MAHIRFDHTVSTHTDTLAMCFKAAPKAIYRRCRHESEGVEKIYKCDLFPDGKDCKDPKFNHSVSDNRINKWCDNCVAAGLGSNYNPKMKPVLPFIDTPKLRLSNAPSQGLVFGVDSDIVLKVPFQYRPADCVHEPHYLDLTIQSLAAFQNETGFYQYLKQNPHVNITRCLNVGGGDCLFLERLTPLDRAWPTSSMSERTHWAFELLGALSWLEVQGWCSGDLAVRNLGVDSDRHLKMFDFGSAVMQSHEGYAYDLSNEHFNLATCFLFIFSGIDPLAESKSYNDVKRITAELKQGLYHISVQPEQVASIIRDGWLGHNATTTFQDILTKLGTIFPGVNPVSPAIDESFYQALEDRCRAWLRCHKINPDWMNTSEYVAACKNAGANVELDPYLS